MAQKPNTPTPAPKGSTAAKSGHMATKELAEASKSDTKGTAQRKPIKGGKK